MWGQPQEHRSLTLEPEGLSLSPGSATDSSYDLRTVYLSLNFSIRAREIRKKANLPCQPLSTALSINLRGSIQ